MGVTRSPFRSGFDRRVPKKYKHKHADIVVLPSPKKKGDDDDENDTKDKKDPEEFLKVNRLTMKTFRNTLSTPCFRHSAKRSQSSLESDILLHVSGN